MTMTTPQVGRLEQAALKAKDVHDRACDLRDALFISGDPQTTTEVPNAPALDTIIRLLDETIGYQNEIKAHLFG